MQWKSLMIRTKAKSKLRTKMTNRILQGNITALGNITGEYYRGILRENISGIINLLIVLPLNLIIVFSPTLPCWNKKPPPAFQTLDWQGMFSIFYSKEQRKQSNVKNKTIYTTCTVPGYFYPFITLYWRKRGRSTIVYKTDHRFKYQFITINSVN